MKKRLLIMGILLLILVLSFFIPVKRITELEEYNKGTLAQYYEYIDIYYNIYGIELFSEK